MVNKWLVPSAYWAIRFNCKPVYKAYFAYVMLTSIKCMYVFMCKTYGTFVFYGITIKMIVVFV